MKFSLTQCTAVIDKYYPDHAVFWSHVLDLRGHSLPSEHPKKYPLVVVAHPQGDGCSVTLMLHGYSTQMQFTIDPYPACCGIRMFHSFTADSRLPVDFAEELLKAFFSENYTAMGASKRLEVVMIEVPTGVKTTDATEEIVPTKDPVIQYPAFYNFFHKNAKLVRTRLQRNSNTGNILHNMEVIL